MKIMLILKFSNNTLEYSQKLVERLNNHCFKKRVYCFLSLQIFLLIDILIVLKNITYMPSIIIKSITIE